MRRRGGLLTGVLLLTGVAFLYEAFCLVDATPRMVVETALHRVTLGVENPTASRLIGAAFLLAGLAVIAAESGRGRGAFRWKPLALGAWAVASACVVVMLGTGMWSLGRPMVEPAFAHCGWPYGVAREADFLYHVALLVWLGTSGTWIVGVPE